MDTKELLAQANIELREGMKAAFEGLKNYGKASIQHTGAVVKNLKENIKARFLAFKESVKPKVSSAKSKLGRIKTSALEKLNPNNLDVRFRDLVERVEIRTLEAAEKGKGFVIDTKDKVVDYASTVAANYYLRQEEIERERQEREEIEAAEREIEAAIKANTKEHKIGMKEALKEQDRREREARRVAFRADVKQKVSSAKGKLGSIKNSLLEKLTSAKDKVSDFFAEQAANHYLRQEERRVERDFKRAQKAAEKEEIEKTKARVRERKADIKYALNAEEREMYEQRHLNNEERKAELMSSLFGQSIENEEVVTSKAM